MRKEQFEQLKTMSLSSLRRLEVESPEEEKLVQEMMNIRLQEEPQDDPNREEFSSTETDFMTPEKEAELQARLDAKRNKVTLQTESEELPVDEPAPDEQEVLVQTKKFCEFCEAKGPIKHQNKCTRPQ